MYKIIAAVGRGMLLYPPQQQQVAAAADIALSTTLLVPLPLHFIVQNLI